MSAADLWTYHDTTIGTADLTGFTVKAIDGSIGKIDEDTADEKVFVNRTKDEIKDAPEFDESRYRDAQYRDEIGGYYGVGGPGYREGP